MYSCTRYVPRWQSISEKEKSNFRQSDLNSKFNDYYQQCSRNRHSIVWSVFYWRIFGWRSDYRCWKWNRIPAWWTKGNGKGLKPFFSTQLSDKVEFKFDYLALDVSQFRWRTLLNRKPYGKPGKSQIISMRKLWRVMTAFDLKSYVIKNK